MEFADLANTLSDDKESEIAEILGEQIEIPKGIIENREIFNEIFSADTWRCLSRADQMHLLKFLPKFPENDNLEKGNTLSMLFNQESFKFGTPLNAFYEKLQKGYFRPDVAHMLRNVKKSERRQFKDQRKRWYYKMLKDVILKRREFLEFAMNSPPGPIKLPRQFQDAHPAGHPVLERVKKRYFQELAAVRSEVGEESQSSEDENYTEKPPRTLSKKQRHKLALLDNSLATTDMTAVTSTLATKPYGFDLETRITNSYNPFEITEEAFQKMVAMHRRKHAMQKRQASQKAAPSTSRSTARPAAKVVTEKVRPGGRRTSVKSAPGGSNAKSQRRKPASASTCSTPVPPSSRVKPAPAMSLALDQMFTKKLIKREPVLPTEISRKSGESTDEEIQRSFDRSEGDKNIDVESASPTNIPQNQQLMENQAQQALIGAMQLPSASPAPVPSPILSSVVNDDEEISKILFTEHSDLMQETYACYFSLLRDIICSSPQQRMRCDIIDHRLKTWECNPISPLNEWFSLVDEPWSNLLDSALKFLSGEYPVELQPDDYVPYIEFKAATRSFQWIGAGRDSDVHLFALCSHWLDHRDELGAVTVADLDLDDVDMDLLDDEESDLTADDAVPPPRCPTAWAVTTSSEADRLEFQRQERERFENPGRAFTYRMHGYESVVGPVKGIYPSSSSVLKPRGHNLLALNRPSYVTVLALVRDAAARLPNGEGTRSDLCTLIRDSQYLDLSDASENTLQGVVSGALDRLHYEADASVKFDTKRKLWIYLHRRRSEAEMEKSHQQNQGAPKTAKKASRRKAAKKVETVEMTQSNESVEKAPTPMVTGRRAKAMPVRPPPSRVKEEGEVMLSELDGSEIATEGTLPASIIADFETTQPAQPMQERRPVAQEILTTAGKKILIHTTMPGRNPVKLVTASTVAPVKQVAGPTGKGADAMQVTAARGCEGAPAALLKVAPAPASSAVSTATTPLIVNNFAGAFVTSTGHKVQIISGTPQNLGQIQSIQLNNGQNILTHSLQTTGSSVPSSTASLLQNLQQVQFITSAGQIISRPIMPPKGTASVLKSSLTAPYRGPHPDLQANSQKPAPRNSRHIRTAAPHASEVRPTMSLLTPHQARPILEKDNDKMKLANMTSLQHIIQNSASGGKVGAQIINVSGVHLLNKPMMSKTNASLLTGVKLVNTQQGVKMVATSATTVVQTNIPSPKITSTVARTPGTQSPITLPSNFTQQVQRTNSQIISMETLVQGARNPGNKASFIQFPSSPGAMQQFAVLPQGSMQPRIIQAQHLTAGRLAVPTSSTSSPSAVRPGVSHTTAPGTAGVTLAGMKPVLLAKPHSQSQNVILTTDGGATGQLGQALVLSPQSNIRNATPGTVTVMQPAGTQQILLPTNFPPGALNLKNLQGLKLIPISTTGQKVYARFIRNPAAPTAAPTPSVTNTEEQS